MRHAVSSCKGVYPEFVESSRAGRKAFAWNGIDGTTEMGPIISENRLRAIEEYVRIGQDEGARLVCGGHWLSHGEYAKGFFHEPTVFADVDPRMRIAQEEIFGPVVSVIPCTDLESAIEIGNGDLRSVFPPSTPRTSMPRSRPCGI